MISWFIDKKKDNNRKEKGWIWYIKWIENGLKATESLLRVNAIRIFLFVYSYLLISYENDNVNTKKEDYHVIGTDK